MATFSRIRYALQLCLPAAALALSIPLSGNAQESISYPSRSSDLAEDSYWTVEEFSEGCCTLDLNVKRWNGSQWSGGDGNSTNEQHYDWDVPLYAPASGEIASCWRNFPDDLAPGMNPPNNDIFTGGNHVVIITDENNAVGLAHFKSGSIPAELCPRNAGNDDYPSTLDKEGDWRVASYIEPADRPRVVQGQFLGRVGNSGNSGGPHLHISMHDILANPDGQGREQLAASSSPMRFAYGWGHRYERDAQDTSGGWYRLRGGTFSGNVACTGYQADAPECGFKMVHASPYLRRASASAGAIKDADVAFLSGNRAVTASIATNNDHLKVIVWDLNGITAIEREGEDEAGAVKQVAISEPAPDHVLVAVRQSDDVLKMIAYRISPTGVPVRVADMTAGKISDLAATNTGGSNPRMVTAVRTEAGNLKIIAWDIQIGLGGVSIERLGEASAGSVSAIAISRARNFNGVYTAVRDGAEQLQVIPWKLASDGNSFARGADGSAGRIGTAIDVEPLAQGVATAVRDDEGNLRLITWSSNTAGDIGARRDTAVAGNISEVTLLGSPHASSNLTSVVRDSEGELLLIGWRIDANGSNVRRLGSSKAGAASKVAASSVSRSYVGNDPRDMILTTLKDASGNLKLITWDTNLVEP
jgi:hypothetical protein